MIFYRNRSIFIRTPKTASSSVLMALFGIKEYKDVSVSSAWMLNEEIKRHLPRGIENKWKHDSHHYPLDTLRGCLPEEHRCLMHGFFKYAFVRNPFDRLVSSYEYMAHCGSVKSDFKEFTSRCFKNENDDVWYWPQVEFTHGCDFIGRFENLQEDFDIVCDKIKIPRQQLPHKNKTKHKHYTEYYNDETRSIVAEKYAKDIEYFGYEFGE